MSKTVYNMPDGNIFNSVEQIAEHYAIHVNYVEDPDNNVQTVVDTCKVLAITRDYTYDTVQTLQAKLAAIDKLIELGTRDGDYFKYDLTNSEVNAAFNAADMIPLACMSKSTFDSALYVLKGELLTVKIGIDVALTNKEQDVWDSYILYMNGKDPEEGFEQE